MMYNKPLPLVNADTMVFWEGCRKHEFRIQRCDDFGHLRWPPSFLCPRCLSKETQWITASGRGVVYSYVIYDAADDPAFRDSLPYVVALVALEEGPHFLTNIVGCAPHDVFCGMAVATSWDDVTETVSLPKFCPAAKE